MEVFLSIPEFRRHKLLIAHGLTLVTPGFRGWEAFPMPRALTHTKITWTLSSMAPQVPGVTLGSPYDYGISGTPHREVCDSFFFFEALICRPSSESHGNSKSMLPKVGIVLRWVTILAPDF